MSHLIRTLLVLVALAITTCGARPDTLHKQMTAQQLQSVFHVSAVDDVPHYEVVKLLHHNTPEPATQHVKQHKRIQDIKEHKVSLNAFGKNFILNFKPTQSLFKNGQVHQVPVYYLTNEVNITNGLNLQRIEDEDNHTSDNVGQVFQDQENKAAVLLRRHESTGELIMEGTLDNEIVIKPLPHNLAPNQNESHHVIYKTESNNPDDYADFAVLEPEVLATAVRPQQRSGHRKNSIKNHDMVLIQPVPPIVFPEILVIVDYDTYLAHGSDNLQLIRYLLSFWNAVDLRFRSLNNPAVHISLVGIVIAMDHDATPYLKNNRIGKKMVEAYRGLSDLNKYLFHEKRLPHYDIVVVLTKLDMCRHLAKNKKCNPSIAGLAYTNGACLKNEYFKHDFSCTLVEDNAGFNGIIVAAHELGHLFGASHDGSPAPSNSDLPGGENCRWIDGYLMSDLRYSENAFHWSTCSEASIHQFLNSGTASCLYNIPYKDAASGAQLPGTQISLDEQCERQNGGTSCYKDEKVCVQLYCLNKKTGLCDSIRPAAEGSPCGDNKHCLSGKCVDVRSNDIPNTRCFFFRNT